MRLLIVDDEANILEGMRRRLRALRGEWAMEFAASGPDALAVLAHTSVDVVLTDMRMPGMDGARLLSEVRRLQPRAARFILSGHAEQESVMSAALVAHQYLAKPCDGEVLERAIRRIHALRQLVRDERLASLAGAIDTLPSQPHVRTELAALLRQPSACLADMVRVISQDVSMTLLVLKLVNSAFFGMPQSIRTLDRAVAFLGRDAMGELFGEGGIFERSASLAGTSLGAAQFWQQSLELAGCARTLAVSSQWDATRADEAYLAARLRDVGQLVMATQPADEFKLAADQDQICARLGAYLLGLWGFPDAIVNGVAFHHKPSSCTAAEAGLAGIIHLAEYFLHQDRSLPVHERPPLDPDFLASPAGAATFEACKAVWAESRTGGVRA